jgi:hypothetical protein
MFLSGSKIFVEVNEQIGYSGSPALVSVDEKKSTTARAINGWTALGRNVLARRSPDLATVL